MNRKSVIVFLLEILTTLFLGGCGFSAGIDTMMKPPKLNVEQEQIYSALTERIGSKVSLKYPKSGDYLSAFIISDIDEEPTNEAIVFYERTGLTTTDEPSLRINILDQRKNGWESVYDYAVADGSEIEKVMISKLGSSDKFNIIVGYSTINQSEKKVGVYQYEDGVLTNTLSSRYSMMDITDIDGNGQNELLIVSNKNASQPAQAHMYMLQSDNLHYIDAVANLSENATEYSNIMYGKVNDRTTAIFIDSIVGTGTIQTEVLYPQEQELKKAFTDTSVIAKTVRPSSYASADIDNDGQIEIPVPEVFLGYDDMPETEQLQATAWYICENGSLTRKYSGYYNTLHGYAFMLPSRWQGQVTIKTDNITDEIIFCKYEGTITDNMTELMRISVTDRKLSDSKLEEGYQIIRTKSDTDYMVRICENDSEPLTPTISEIMFNFFLIEK